MWCEQCGEAHITVRLQEAGLCDDCCETTIQEVLQPVLGYTPCSTIIWPNREPAFCMVEAGTEHDHGGIS